MALADTGHIIGLTEKSSLYDCELAGSVEYTTIYIVIVSRIQLSLFVLDIPKEQITAHADNYSQDPTNEQA